MTEFSNRLKRLREEKGWSKTKLAGHIGVSLSTYANWEYGIAEFYLFFFSVFTYIFLPYCISKYVL